MKVSKRWLPAIVAPSLIAAITVALPLQANAVDLPDLTPQQVLLLMDGEVTRFSGTIVKTSDLGLPALEMSSMMDEESIKEMEEKIPEGFEDFVPQVIEQSAITEAIGLISGTHRIRVYASEVGMRVQILDSMGQRDLIVNKDEFWLYNADAATAQTGTFDYQVSEADKVAMEAELKSRMDQATAQFQLDLSNPEAVADYLMSMVDKTTEVTVGKDHMVAGRTAYQLIAQPKAENSLVESIVLSVDSETGMALDVKVYSIEKDTPVFQVGFESISFETPNPELFSFTPPAGTTVTELEVPADLKAQAEELKAEYEAEYEGKELTEEDKAAMKAELEAALADEVMPELIGEHWDSVVYLAELPAEVPMAMLENELFADLMVLVPGGKVFSTPLVNVMITDAGEVFAGAVTIDYLQEVAAR